MIHRPSCPLALILVVLAACLPAPTAGAQPVDSYARYYYFDEPRELPLDGSRIAIRDRRGRPEEIEEFLRGLGIPEPALDRSFTGWSLFQVSEASGPTRLATEERIAEQIDRFATADALDQYFFSPVFTGEYGPILPTSKVLVRFEEGSENDLDDRPLTDWEIRQIFLDLGVPPSWWEPLSPGSRTFVVEQPGVGSGVKVMRLANRLAEDPRLSVAEPDFGFTGRPSAIIPNDPNYADIWGLHNRYTDVDIDAPAAWARTTGDQSVIVVIIDTGIEEGHPDLPVLSGKDFTGQGGSGRPVEPCDIHGTPVAGVIGMIMNNGKGGVGVAPNARLVSARPFISNVDCDAGWFGLSSWTVAAIEWAQEIGARITNNSNRYGVASASIETAYNSTYDAGLIHFASAGNTFELPDTGEDPRRTIWFPARLLNINAVTAIDHLGHLTYFSHFGEEADFTGAGLDVFTIDMRGSGGWVMGDYLPNAQGTSFSSPQIAGVAALMLSEAFSLHPEELEHLMREAAKDLGAPDHDPKFGWGLPSAQQGLDALDLLIDDFDSGDLSRWSDHQP